MTTVYLIRHAHADWQPDEARPLSTRGRTSAALLAEHFAEFPVAAIYTSPARRALETVEPIAHRLRLQPVVLADLREREVTTGSDHQTAVEATWRNPSLALPGSESNAAAQARGTAVVRQLLQRHSGGHIIVATHGNLLALVLNGFASGFGYDFWRSLSFPDAYELHFHDVVLSGVRRIWDPTFSPIDRLERRPSEDTVQR